MTSLSIAVLLLANNFLLLTKQHGVCPRSHRLTAAFFTFASSVYVIRAVYYLVWNTQSEQAFFQHNIIQDIAYLTNPIFIVGTSFGFALMCNEKYQEELKESEQQFRLLIEKMPLALSLTNDKDELIFINERFKNTFGYSLDELSSTEHWWSLAYPNENHSQQSIAISTTMDIECLEYRITCKNGAERVMLMSEIDLSDGHIYTYVDITDRKVAEEKIRQLAFYDLLTGLPNRRNLMDKLQHAITRNHRSNSQFAVFMMDLDKFKAVNDSFGHAAGDELLKQVALRITHCLRESDMVARLGGDEFVLVLENLKNPETVEIIALKVIADLAVLFQLSETDSAQIGASIGISLYPQHGNTPEKLIDHADIALYQAKDNGRNCFVYFSDYFSEVGSAV